MTSVGTVVGRRVTQLEQVARRLRPGKTPEQAQLQRIAIESAADGREALAIYKERGDEAGATERDYRKMQYALAEVLSHLKAKGLDELSRTPGPEWPVWTAYRRNLAEPGETPAATAARPIPADVWVGDLKTAKATELVINGLCSDARYARDTALSRSRSSGKALAMFDRIINLMQSLMRQEDFEGRISASGAAELGWTEDEEP